MNILFFSRYFYPHIGGVEKHVLEISRELVKRGHKVSVICEITKDGKDPGKTRMVTLGKIKVYHIPVGRNEFLKKFTIWKWFIKNQNLLRQADVIHAHDVFYWWIPFLLLFPKKKIYTTFHGYEGNSLPTKQAIFMHRLAANFSKKSISVGSFYEKWYGTKSDAVIYGSVAKKLLTIKPITHSQSRINLVFIGRLEKETGIMDYLKAAKILKERNIAFCLEILGEGSLRKDAEQFIKDNKLHTRIHGFVKNIEPFLEKADIAFVSRYLSILEAFALKKYVIAVYSNEIKKDYLEMTPFATWMSICKNEDEIADSVLSFLRKRQSRPLTTFINYAFSWVSQQTWEHAAEIYLSHWLG